ncbi:hypothetical protein [Propionispora hippei]|nr:hypothetical protein [Propionispora hippei]
MGNEKKPSRQWTTAGRASFLSEPASAGIEREDSSKVVIIGWGRLL